MKKFLYFVLITFFLISCKKSDPPPVADFILETGNLTVGQELWFENTSEHASRFEWDFGDGFISEEDSPFHTYNSNGTFEVILTAFSDNGEESEASMVLDVKIPTLLVVEVREYNNEGFVVPNASVILFDLLSDWDEHEPANMVLEGVTDSNGFAVFANLDQDVYYVDVWNSSYDNWQLGLDNVGYIQTPEIIPNQINKFVALATYYPEGKGTKRSMRPVIQKIERKTGPVNEPVIISSENWKELYQKSVKLKK